MFRAEKYEISEFLSENFHVLVLNVSVYLNRLVFVMDSLRKLIFVDTSENVPIVSKM